MYVADVTNSGICLPDNECFIQTLALHQTAMSIGTNTVNILFSENTATLQGPDLQVWRTTGQMYTKSIC